MAARALRAPVPAAACAPRGNFGASSSGRAARLFAPQPRQAARSRQRPLRFPRARAAPSLSEADDTEFRGSNAPLALLKRCDALADPASAGVTYADALRSLVDGCITVFTLGFSEDDIRSELDAVAAASEDAGCSERVCETVAIVFITLETLPAGTLKRWGRAEGAVSQRSLALWRGFCRLISDAYFHKGYAWYPIDRLQLEQAATLGRVEAAPLVAERMSVVYQTLNTVAPRFPSMFD